MILKQLALAAFATAVLFAVQSPVNADRSDCEEWGCRANGTQLTGIADPTSSDRDRFEWFGGCDDWGCGGNGTRPDGRALQTEQPSANAIILPSGEILDLR